MASISTDLTSKLRAICARGETRELRATFKNMIPMSPDARLRVINTPDKKGRTCLHLATAGGFLHCVTILVRAGADTKAKDIDGKLPIDCVDMSLGIGCQRALSLADRGVAEIRQLQKDGHYGTVEVPIKSLKFEEQFGDQPRSRRRRGVTSGGNVRGREAFDKSYDAYKNVATREFVPVAPLSFVLSETHNSEVQGHKESSADTAGDITSEEKLPGIVVASYNTLADAYAFAHYFPWSSKDDLAFDARLMRITEEVSALNCDVLCLQEVDHFESFQKAFARLNLTGVYAKRNKKPDGCALFFSSSLRMIATKNIQFDDIASAQNKKHSVLQLALLRHVATKKLLCVANTHLYYKGGAKNEQSAQIDMQVESFLRDVSPEDKNIPVVCCGDFNAPPNGAVFNQMLKSGFTSVLNQGADASLTPTARVEAASASRHQIPATFFANATSPKFYDFMFIKGGLKVTHYLSLPDKQLLLPNAQCGSDHIIIAAHLTVA